MTPSGVKTANFRLVARSLNHLRHRFSGKVVENKICVLIFSERFSERFLILRRLNVGTMTNVQYIRRHVQYPVVLSLLMKLGFVDRFSKNPRIPYLLKIRPVGTELFNTDRRTDRQMGMTNLLVTSLNFARSA